jgi:hypothetical protein
VYSLSQNSSHVSADVSFGELVSKIEKDLMESTVNRRTEGAQSREKSSSLHDE